MKKTIRNTEYDTETASVIRKFTEGHYGDERGYEESLYQTPAGLYFLYVNGGSESPYSKENIKAVSKRKAEEWLSLH